MKFLFFILPLVFVQLVNASVHEFKSYIGCYNAYRIDRSLPPSSARFQKSETSFISISEGTWFQDPVTMKPISTLVVQHVTNGMEQFHMPLLPLDRGNKISKGLGYFSYNYYGDIGFLDTVVYADIRADFSGSPMNHWQLAWASFDEFGKLDVQFAFQLEPTESWNCEFP